MTHHSIPELDRAGLRRFGLSTGAAVAVLFGLVLPWIFGFAWPRWPWYLAGTLALMAVAIPAALGPVYRVWMRFGLLMSKITTPLILGIVFFGVVFPMALVMKIIKRDPMAREFERDKDSYRVPSIALPRERLERPF